MNLERGSDRAGERIVVGVDIGTTKVCAIVASADGAGRVNVLGVGVAESDGLNRGVVVNIDRTVASLQKAVREAERAAGVEVKSVVVGIAGDHIHSDQSRGVITIAGRNREVTAADVHRLIEDTKQVALPSDREILHVIPQEFIVDGQDGVADPVGMSGVRLEANVHIITGLVSAAKNVYRCVEKAGYQVADIVLEPLASSYAVLHPDEKEVGVVLVDIGGGTTDIAVFEDQTIRHTAVIAVAGNKVTDDIRKGLGVMRDQAERLKHLFGSALVDLADEQDIITIPGIGGRPEKDVSRSVLAQIIQPRLEEILEIAYTEVKRGASGRHLSAGVVLTGGGALIPGTAELAADIMGMEARIGAPSGLNGGLVAEVSDPKFATAVGLVLYGLRPEAIGGSPLERSMGARLDSGDGAIGVEALPPGEGLFRRIGDRMRGWFDEL
jgi:cell division protein FtsA